jgi:acetoin utilization deacetylase AcuC-like enzyme
MLVLHADDAFLDHDTGEGHPECPERARVITRALASHPAVARSVAAVAARPDDVHLVHDPGYVEALRRFIDAGAGAIEADTASSPGSWKAASLAAGAVVRAVEDALAASPDAPEARSFCAVRPPGHHARPAAAMGFCLLNNVAVAAARAVEVAGADRVAILDFDVHHGNGTQEIFWRDGRVLYVSLHRWPFYPGTGAADETGEGPGKGTTLNLPLRAGTGSAKYREAFAKAIEGIRAFRPAVLIASAGFDAYARDPIGGLGLAADDYRWIGEQVRAVADDVCRGRVVSALEGGYAVSALPELVTSYVEGLEKS